MYNNEFIENRKELVEILFSQQSLESFRQELLLVLELLRKKEIQEYLEELTASDKEDNEALKRYVTESLKAILREASCATYRDRRGTELSPAPLRSVAVQAAKALMELHPIKAAQSHNLNINGEGEGGITFNVIVPNQQNKDSEPVK